MENIVLKGDNNCRAEILNGSIPSVLPLNVIKKHA
jgi:hypothetical protein